MVGSIKDWPAFLKQCFELFPRLIPNISTNNPPVTLNPADTSRSSSVPSGTSTLTMAHWRQKLRCTASTSSSTRHHAKPAVSWRWNSPSLSCYKAQGLRLRITRSWSFHLARGRQIRSSRNSDCGGELWQGPGLKRMGLHCWRGHWEWRLMRWRNWRDSARRRLWGGKYMRMGRCKWHPMDIVERTCWRRKVYYGGTETSGDLGVVYYMTLYTNAIQSMRYEHAELRIVWMDCTLNWSYFRGSGADILQNEYIFASS